MTTLNNITKININGNDIKKIDTYYNTNLKSKTTTAITQTTLEEAVNANKIICNFEYNNQHEANMLYENINISTPENNISTDLTYGLTMQISNKTFTYTADSLKDVTTPEVYLSTTATDDSTNTTYTLTNSTDVITNVPDVVKKIIVASDVGIKFNVTRTEPLTVIFNKIDITQFPQTVTNGKIYVVCSYEEFGTAGGVKPNITASELHLSHRFFNNVDLSEATVKQFGDFGNGTIGKLHIKRDNIYTNLSGSALILKLASLLNFPSGDIILE